MNNEGFCPASMGQKPSSLLLDMDNERLDFLTIAISPLSTLDRCSYTDARDTTMEAF